MAREDLTPPLDSIAAGFPGTRYVLFGFGDRRYLVHGANISGALWPGAGIVLVTTVSSPQLTQAFPADDVASFALSRPQMTALQDFVVASLSQQGQVPPPVAPGPYAGSAYYPAVQRYSAVHTCNTWAAEALQHAGLPVTSRGVEFSWQVWRQVRRIERERPAAGAQKGTTGARWRAARSAAQAAARARSGLSIDHQLQGGWLPSWQTTVVPELGGTTTVVDFGGGGLLLLMQAPSSGKRHKAANRAFIGASSL
jgi:Protein of unknown function (DUF2459)